MLRRAERLKGRTRRHDQFVPGSPSPDGRSHSKFLAMSIEPRALIKRHGSFLEAVVVERRTYQLLGPRAAQHCKAGRCHDY